MFAGLPDFGFPETFSNAIGFAAYEQPGSVCVVPGSLRAEPLQIDQYIQERDDRVVRFALVSAGFTIGGDVNPSPRIRPAPLGTGQVRLVAPAVVGVPAALLTPQPCDAATGIVLPTVVRLDGLAGDLLVGALRGGLRTLGAVMAVSVRGVASRCPGTLTVDVGALRRGVGIAPVRPDDLLDRVTAGLAGITVRGGPADERVLATAVVDRIVARLAAPAFLDTVPAVPTGAHPQDRAPTGSAASGDATATGCGWLFAPGEREAATLTWDLDQPLMTVRLLRLACDPVLGGDEAKAIVREHQVSPLTDGRECLLIHNTLPALPAGVVTASVTLTAPPAPPARPFETEVIAEVQPLSPTEVILRLAPGEPLVYDLEGSAVLDTDHGPRVVGGTARRVVGDLTPVVTPADLGLRFIPVHATRGLLGLADVTVTARAARWLRDPAVFVSTVDLRPSAAQDAWLAVPRDAAEVTVQAAATTRGAHPRTVDQSLPDAAVWLDPFSFTDPPWDRGQEQEQEEEMRVVETAGLRAAGPKGGQDWRFLPIAAGLVRSEAGDPQLNLIEAGGLAMLMVTTALEVSDAAQAAVRASAVKAGAPADVRLSPAPFEVEGAVELLITRDGQRHPIATSMASATVSQDAVFSVTLDEGDLAVVRRALAGEAGLLAARYLLRVVATGPLAEALSPGSGPITVVTDASSWRA
ncbi:MAG: hypothetical protein QM674_13575 [Burkholderiaceae bacterium]